MDLLRRRLVRVERRGGLVEQQRVALDGVRAGDVDGVPEAVDDVRRLAADLVEIIEGVVVELGDAVLTVLGDTSQEGLAERPVGVIEGVAADQGIRLGQQAQ